MEEEVLDHISWRGVGEVMGYVAFVETVVLIGLSIALITDPWTYLLFLVITLLADISWLFGCIRYKTGYMFIALVWYLIPISICLNYTISSIVKLMTDIKTNTKDNDIFAVTVLTCGFIIFYILGALSFASMWRTTHRYNG